jgi:hypothetical protein
LLQVEGIAEKDDDIGTTGGLEVLADKIHELRQTDTVLELEEIGGWRLMLDCQKRFQFLDLLLELIGSRFGAAKGADAGDFDLGNRLEPVGIVNPK